MIDAWDRRAIGVAYSVALHIMVVVFLMTGLPFLATSTPEVLPTLTVEIVDIVRETNLNEGLPIEKPASSSEEDAAPSVVSAPPPPPPPPPPVAEKTPVTPPTPPAAPPAPSQEAVAIPQPKPKTVTPPSVSSSQTTSKKASASVSAPPKRPAFLTKKNSKNDQLDALAAQLQNLAGETSSREKEEDDQEKQQKIDEINDEIRQVAGQAINAPPASDDRLGADIATLLKNHISVCWSPPSAVEDARNLIVDIIVQLNKEREVTSVTIKNQVRYTADRGFQVAANAVERAIRDCSPLTVLPPEKYDLWKTLEFKFDPKLFL